MRVIRDSREHLRFSIRKLVCPGTPQRSFDLRDALLQSDGHGHASELKMWPFDALSTCEAVTYSSSSHLPTMHENHASFFNLVLHRASHVG